MVSVEWISFGIVVILFACTLYARHKALSMIAPQRRPPYQHRNWREFYIKTSAGIMEVPATTVQNARRFALREERRMKEMR